MMEIVEVGLIAELCGVAPVNMIDNYVDVYDIINIEVIIAPSTAQEYNVVPHRVTKYRSTKAFKNVVRVG